ncbi:accessory factor UbiK family protein [Ferrimonas pelagia]|uniref:Ubiquinone biosynthesis accessory factor UbiK n=1 Tax=Ferrimonas pelagia TaxID=1177826 RepID=A0ABP9F1B1_9GAMM
MLNPQKLEELAQQLASTLPPGVKAAADEFEVKAKSVLQSQLSKLDFVSRDEFDRQTAVLAKTRMMVEQLEARLDALETPAPEQSDAE